MTAEAQESVDLQALTFDQLAEAARLATRTLREQPDGDDRVEYFAADSRLRIPTATIYKGLDGKYCIFFNPSFGCVVARSFATMEEAKSSLINEVFIPNGYRVM